MQEQTDLFGIPVPSTDKVFLTFVVIHITVSLFAGVSGLFAMLSDKISLGHRRRGTVYYWSMAGAFVTIIILSAMRWPHNIHLLTIGVMAFAAAYAGRILARRKTRLHTMCMGASYILLLTGFYVDNGKNLPFWKMFPDWFFYLFPAAVGIPISFMGSEETPLKQAKLIHFPRFRHFLVGGIAWLS